MSDHERNQAVAAWVAERGQEIVMVNVPVTVSGAGLAASAIFTWKVKVPFCVGVPEITPVVAVVSPRDQPATVWAPAVRR